MSRGLQETELTPAQGSPLSGAKTCLVVAAHPDDEVLGCGGTIAALSDTGAKVHVLFLADGVGARRSASDVAGDPEVRERRGAAEKAAQALGISSVAYGDFPDNRMDSVDLLDVVKKIEASVNRLEPDLVLTHHAGDVNVDHSVIHRATVTACRPQPGHPVKTLLFFEVPSSTEWAVAGFAPFVPNWFVDISAQLERRQKALAAYEAEMRDWPHARSYRATEQLARWRGATVGVEAAEAFMLGRHVQRG